MNGVGSRQTWSPGSTGILMGSDSPYGYTSEHLMICKLSIVWLMDRIDF